MWLVMFGLVCFWSGLAALIARLCGWPVILPALVTAFVSGAILSLIMAVCKMSATTYPEDRPINIQTYFGVTFVMKKSHREVS